MGQNRIIVSDTEFRRVEASRNADGKICIARIWKRPVNVKCISVSLTELEKIVGRFNGGM